MDNLRSEKYLRYRRKQALIKQGQNILNRWIIGYSAIRKRPVREVRATINAITRLKKGWNEADFELAQTKLKEYSREIFSFDKNQLESHIAEGRRAELRTALFGDNPKGELTRATQDAMQIFGMMVAAAELSERPNSDLAAAAFAFCHFVGVRLLKDVGNGLQEPGIAVAYMLNTVGHQSKKPEWVAELVNRLTAENNRDLRQLMTAGTP